MSSNINAGRGLAVIIAATILVLLVSTVLASGIGAFNDGETSSFEQDEGQTVQLAGALEATVDSVDDTNGDATITVEDTDLDESDTVTVSEEETETAVVDGEDIDVTVDEISGSTVSVEYNWPTDYNWSGGASSIFQFLDLIVVLTVILLLIGWVMTTWKN